MRYMSPGADARLSHACRNCGVLACRLCCVEDHLPKGHCIISVEAAAEEAVQAIATGLPALRTCLHAKWLCVHVCMFVCARRVAVPLLCATAPLGGGIPVCSCREVPHLQLTT